MNCEDCKHRHLKMQRGKYQSRSVFSCCGHIDNCKIKNDPVKGDVYIIQSSSIHKKWNKDNNCSRWEKPSPPPVLYPDINGAKL